VNSKPPLLGTLWLNLDFLCSIFNTYVHFGFQLPAERKWTVNDLLNGPDRMNPEKSEVPTLAAEAGSSLREQAAYELFRGFQDATLETLNSPLRQLKNWSTVTIMLVSLSVILIIAGAASALYGMTQVGVLTSVSSILSSLISAVLFSQLKQARQEVQESRQKILDEFKAASDRFFGSAPVGSARMVVYVAGKPTYSVGRFVRIDDVNWRDESIREDESYLYRFTFSRYEGNVLFLTDKSRNLEVEINLDGRQVWWTSPENQYIRSYLYRIVAIL